MASLRKSTLPSSNLGFSTTKKKKKKESEKVSEYLGTNWTKPGKITL